jgi:hypothetical protein
MVSTIAKWIVLMGLVVSIVVPALADDQKDVRTISVAGEAEIKVTPDRVVIIVGIEKIDSVMAKAKKFSDTATKNAIDGAHKNGISDSDISSEFFNVQPNHRYQDERDIFYGYLIRRKIAITLNDITKFESLMADLMSSGITNVQSIQFQITDLRKYRDQARANAIKAASEKANAMASELGIKVGKARTINETGSRWYSGYWDWYDYGYYGYNSGRNNYMSQNSTQIAPSSTPSADNPMALGKISVTASVSVVFELE